MSLYSSEYGNKFYTVCVKDATNTQVRLILQQIRYLIQRYTYVGQTGHFLKAQLGYTSAVTEHVTIAVRDKPSIAAS